MNPGVSTTVTLGPSPRYLPVEKDVILVFDLSPCPILNGRRLRARRSVREARLSKPRRVLAREDLPGGRGIGRNGLSADVGGSNAAMSIGPRAQNGLLLGGPNTTQIIPPFVRRAVIRVARL